MTRRDLRRAGDALLWSVMGAIAAPVLLGLGVTLVGLARGHGVGAIGGGVFMLSVALFVSFAFALLPYALLLLAWAALAPRLGGETRVRVVVLTAALALPVAIVVAWRSEGAAVALAMVWLPTWLGLLLPRLLVPRLAPGAFARRHAPTPAE